MQCHEVAGAKFSEWGELKKARQDVTTMVVHAAGLRSRGTGNGATRIKSNDKRSVAAAGGGGGRRRRAAAVVEVVVGRRPRGGRCASTSSERADGAA